MPFGKNSKTSPKNKINFQNCHKSLNNFAIRCAHSKIGRVEIRMQPNERRKRILELLSFRRHDTMGSLAQEFGVSRGTICRDILILQSEYPIISETGRRGGISLPDGYYLFEKHLSPKQADAIRKCLLTADSDLQPVLTSILDDFAW